VYWVTLGLLFAAFVGLLVGFFMTFGSFRIASTTMAPTLQPRDVAISQRGASGIARGDVVIVEVPGGGGVLPRRVMGLPGDRVTCCTTGGQVTVDGKALAEDYLTPGPSTTYSTMPFNKIVPQGKIWVMGDNRADAADSRQWGPLPTSAIVGRVVLVISPGATRALRTPTTFTANGLAPADNRVPLPLLLLLLAMLAALATAVEGTVGLIVWLVRRSRRQRVQQPRPMAW
jgi:signal peptidase I